MKKEQIFSCRDINWEEVEDLFAKINGEKPEGKVEEGLLLPELPIIGDHVQSCANCRETLVALAKKHGITRGIIFPKNLQKDQR